MPTIIDGTSGVTFPAGGVGNPAGAVVGTTDTQTLTNKTLTTPVISSLSSASATALTLQSAGTTAITVDTSQNVGINTTSPTQPLQINMTTGDQGIKLQAHNTTAGNRLSFADSSGTEYGLVNYDHGSDFMSFYTNSSERMRITSAGNVGIGITSTTEKLYVNGTAVIDNYLGVNTSSSSSAHINILTLANTRPGIIVQSANSASNGSLITFLNLSAAVAGSITHVSSTAVLYNTTSDYRLKTVVGSISDAGERIDALEPIEYDWNEGGRTRGFLAHKFAEVYPNSVTGEKDGVDKDGKPKYQAMQASTSEVMADLIAEIQSLRKRVAQLESK